MWERYLYDLSTHIADFCDSSIYGTTDTRIDPIDEVFSRDTYLDSLEI